MSGGDDCVDGGCIDDDVSYNGGCGGGDGDSNSDSDDGGGDGGG